MTHTDTPASISALSAQESAFVDYIWENQSAGGRAAALAAKFPKANASRTAKRLLARVDIRAALQERHDQWQAANLVDATWLLRRLVADVNFDVSEILDPATSSVLPVSQWPLQARRMIAGIDVEEITTKVDGQTVTTGVVKKIRFEPKTARLKMIGDHSGVRAFQPSLVVAGDIVVELRDYSGNRGGERPHELGAIEVESVVEPVEGDASLGAKDSDEQGKEKE